MQRNDPQRIIRLYVVNRNGDLEDWEDEIDLEDVCGTVPRVGDCIVSRYRQDANVRWHVWQNRTVWEVVAVYFRPDKHIVDERDDYAYVSVVIKERPMTEAERGLL